jgi:hypothetical protein
MKRKERIKILAAAIEKVQHGIVPTGAEYALVNDILMEEWTRLNKKKV